MERTLIQDLHDHVGKKAVIAGWIDVRRDHGKLIFLDVRDRGGVIQVVVSPKQADALQTAEQLRGEWVITICGTVTKRPENMKNPDQPNGDIEFSAETIDVLSQACELPFDREEKLNLDTYLDHLPFTLRSSRARDIFTVQATIIDAFRDHMRGEGFMEYQSPTLVQGDAEGGAAAFTVDYYHDQKAFLATSPQLYKQMMVGIFERVFTTTKAFRAEKHSTSRHLSEVTQLDFEMGFVKDHRDVMAMLKQSISHICTSVKNTHSEILKRFGMEDLLVPDQFPTLTLSEAQQVIEKEFGEKAVGEPDLDPTHERQISEWARKEHDSDFAFVTHFPTDKRPFYTHEEEGAPEQSRSFDLIFRGLEINSGSQRVHDYDALVTRIREKGLDPKVFSFYLQAFKYGMPPHGGCSTGLERLTARMLGLSNIREATLFPRDMNRIDKLLSDT